MTTPPSQIKNEQPKKHAPDIKPASTVRDGMEQTVSSQSLTAALENTQTARPETILRLQRLAGNRAVTDLIQHNGLSGIWRAREDEEEKLQAKSLPADPLSALESMRDERMGALGLAKPGSAGEGTSKFVPQPVTAETKAEPQTASKAESNPKPVVEKAAAPVKTAVVQPFARSYGVLSSAAPQTKLIVSEPGDQQEIEADQVSEQVMKMPALATPPPPSQPSQPNDDENNNPNSKRPAILNRYLQRNPIQRSADGIGGNVVSDDVQSRIEGMQQGGQPLPDSEREFFEPRMGVDLSNVRVHTDNTAIETSKELNARAYTVGSSVAFNSGEFQPGTTEGRKLLGHELTHVVQQGAAGELQRKVPLQPALQKFSLPSSFNLPSPKISTPVVQRAGFFDDAKKFVGDFGNAASEMGGKIVKAGSEFLSLGFNSFAELVAHFAPQLAELIKKGPLAILTEKIQGALQNWIHSLLGDIDIGAVVGEVYSMIGTAFETVKMVLDGAPKDCDGSGNSASCAKFTQNLNKLSNFAEKILNNPVLQKMQDTFARANAAFAEVTKLVIAPAFDSVMQMVGDVFNQVKGFAEQIWSWTAPVRSALSAAWNWVKEQLGIAQEGANGVLEWLKTKASEAWQAIQDKLAPVMGPIKAIGMGLAAFTPVGWFVIAAQVAPQLIEMVQWLWDNKDNPNIIEAAHEQMGHTILPQLLSSLQSFGQGLSSAVDSFGAKIQEIGTAALALFESISGIPIFEKAQAFISGMSRNVQRVMTWVDTTWKNVSTGFQQFAAFAQEKLRPYIGVLVQIGTAIAFPGAIPGILAGEFWLQLHGCYKGPIIDFLLKLAINFLEATPDLPIFGVIWPMAKAGVLGFLRGLFAKPVQTKVIVANKIAEILTCRNLDFMGGLLKGFLKGIWEGITDPFVTIYAVVKGLGDLVVWFTDASVETGETEKQLETDTNVQQAVSKGDGSDSFNRAEFSSMAQDMGNQLSEPVNNVTENFQPAVQEALGGAGGQGGDLTFESLMTKLGEIGNEILNNMESFGGVLADKLCEFFTSDQADDQLGETIGWWAGTISFEILLSVLTSGAWAPVSVAGKLLKTFARVLDWTSEVMGQAFKALSKVGELLLDAIKGIQKLFSKADGAIARVLGALGVIGVKLQEFAAQLIKRFKKGSADEMLGNAAGDLTKYGDEGAALIAKYGDQAKVILTKYGDEGFHVLSKHGDDVPQLINKLGGDDEFGRLINELGGGEGFSALYSKFDGPEHFLKTLEKVPDAKRLNRLASLPKINNINQLDELLDKFTSPSQLERLLKLDKVADADSLMRLANLVDDPMRLGGLINLTDNADQLEKFLGLIGNSSSASKLEDLLRLAGSGNTLPVEKLLQLAGGDAYKFDTYFGAAKKFRFQTPPSSMPMPKNLGSYAGADIQHFWKRHTYESFDFSDIKDDNTLWPTGTNISDVLDETLDTMKTMNINLSGGHPQEITLSNGIKVQIGIRGNIIRQFFPVKNQPNKSIINFTRSEMEAFKDLFGK